MGWVALLVHGLAALYPFDADYGEQIEESLTYLGTPFEPETVVRAGFGGGIVALLPGAALVILSPLPVYVSVVIAFAFSLVTIQGIHDAPNLAARLARTRATGEIPNLIGRIVLRMQIQPTIENAVRFAADTGEGPLSDSLNSHIDASLGSPQTGLLSFSDEWSENFPALQRSTALLVSAQDAPPGERGRSLDRALNATLDGTREQMADFTSSIQGPTTALYAFGVMMPLALVALFPAAGLAGFGGGVSIWVFVIIYDFIIPVGLIGASYWLLVRRPVAFPPPRVSRSHPDVPTSRLPSLLAGLGVGAVAFLLTFLFSRTLIAPVAGLGLGLGTFLLVYYRPIMVVRNHVKAVEEHLVDALYISGRLVAEDHAVESAIEQGANRIPAATGEVFQRASNLQKRVHLGVRESFHGEYGALRNVPSTRADSTTGLLAIASEEGQPAGNALVSMANHIEELQEVEKETKRSLSRVTDTLDNTAAFFGPLVAGATVGLAGGIANQTEENQGATGTEDSANGATESANSEAAEGLPGDIGIDLGEAVVVSPEMLGLVIGIFVILLCLILVPLSISLKYGFDRALIGYSIGTSLLAAIPIYVISMMLVTLLL